MGCSNERTIEKPEEKNKGFPVCRYTHSLTGEICSMVALNSKLLVLGGNNELLLFDLNSKEIIVISKENNAKKNRVNHLIKIPDGKVISGHQNGAIKVWDIENKKVLYTLEGHASMIWDLCYIGEDKLISGSDDNICKIWNLKNKTNEVLYKSKKQISSIIFMGNKKVLLASGKNVFLFDIEKKDQECVLDVSAWSLTKLKNGDVAAGLGNGLLYILQVTDEILKKSEFPRGHNKVINSIIELENNKIITRSDENDLILWDINDTESIYMIKGHNARISCLCLIEGNKFASISIDNTLKIWE